MFDKLRDKELINILVGGILNERKKLIGVWSMMLSYCVAFFFLAPEPSPPLTMETLASLRTFHTLILARHRLRNRWTFPLT